MRRAWYTLLLVVLLASACDHAGRTPEPAAPAPGPVPSSPVEALPQASPTLQPVASADLPPTAGVEPAVVTLTFGADEYTYLSEHVSEGPGVLARRSVAGGMPTESTDVERIASLASMDYEPVGLERWRDRSRWTGWMYPWFQQAARDVLAGERFASEVLELVQGQAEEFLACLTGGEERLDEAEARACAVQIDPEYLAAP